MTLERAKEILASVRPPDKYANISKKRATWLALKSTLWIATFPLVLTPLFVRTEILHHEFQKLKSEYPKEFAALYTKDKLEKARMIEGLPNYKKFWLEF